MSTQGNESRRAGLKHATGLLQRVAGQTLDREEVSEATCALAGDLLAISHEVETRSEKKQRAVLARLMDDRKAQLFSTLLTDRVPRLQRGADVVHQARNVLGRTGIPPSMPWWDRVQLRALNWVGPILPDFVANAVRGRIKSEALPFLIPGERDRVGPAVKALKGPGVRVNVNQLGEEVLGHGEAERHMEEYLTLLANPDVDTISVKISSICAQLEVLAWDTSLDRVCASLERLYRAAILYGRDNPKLVMLDMEAYQDLELTHRAFVRVLSQKEFQCLKAGIVLQAYLPDSHQVQEELNLWAKERVASGGAPIQMRLVKGANLAVERVEASISGWANPIYESKPLVDASFKTMVERGLSSETVEAVELGIASHNLFDVAYALVLAHERGIKDRVHFEVLSGMAGALSRTLLALGQEVLVYTPAVADAHLHSAVAYLVRRLDENTADENFLRHSFAMRLGDEAWEEQKEGFLEARRLQQNLDTTPKRGVARPAASGSRDGDGTFANEIDTDFTLRAHREWIVDLLQAQRDERPPHLPLLIGGRNLQREPTPGFDPGRPDYVPYFISFATSDDIHEALRTAAQALETWSTTTLTHRISLLRSVAGALRAERGKLIAAMVMDGGKSVIDADAEVSEAIDFAEYYAVTAQSVVSQQGLHFLPRGITVVTPPWNFPLAIPLGGVFAALVTGNTVILKPACETAYIATRAVQICYEAGIPRKALQLVIAEDEVATELIVNPMVQTVVLTGGTSTARLFKRLRPDLHLLAETGGKNATIVSRYADRDLAVHAVVESAFGHAGQKCSATSLLILPPELVNDPLFREQLIDAARSMHVGPGWDLEAKVTTLIHPPEGALKEGLTTLEDGETWWLEPQPSPDNPRLWSPGIKAGVKAGSFGHVTEFFGPVLSVLTAESLDKALALANATEYGLTAGFHSLDEDEITEFIEKMNAGNLYVNRTTTGAIVRRQPFGGRKASSFGPGAKAGGPNYVSLFVRTLQVELPRGGDGALGVPDISLLGKATERWPDATHELECFASRFAVAAEEVFFRAVDPSQLRGQDNHYRYQFHTPILLIAFKGSNPVSVVKAALAMSILGTPFRVCCDADDLRDDLSACLGSALSSKGWQDLLQSGHYSRVRTVGMVPEEVWEEAAGKVSVVDNSPVLDYPRREGLKYCVEQTISVDFHRYGYLGLRELPTEGE